jgi:hypothetical protein
MVWTKMSETYYESLYYDVYFQYGVWRGAFYLYRPFPKDFNTPEEAMAYCESWSRDPWPAMP